MKSTQFGVLLYYIHVTNYTSKNIFVSNEKK